MEGKGRDDKWKRKAKTRRMKTFSHTTGEKEDWDLEVAFAPFSYLGKREANSTMGPWGRSILTNMNLRSSSSSVRPADEGLLWQTEINLTFWSQSVNSEKCDQVMWSVLVLVWQALPVHTCLPAAKRKLGTREKLKVLFYPWFQTFVKWISFIKSSPVWGNLRSSPSR